MVLWGKNGEGLLVLTHKYCSSVVSYVLAHRVNNPASSLVALIIKRMLIVLSSSLKENCNRRKTTETTLELRPALYHGVLVKRGICVYLYM